MKKIFKNVVLAFCAMSLVGVCGCVSTEEPTADTSDPAAVEQEVTSVEEETVTEDVLTFGSSFEFDNLTITIGDSISTTTLDNEFSELDGEMVVALPISVTNNADETHGLNMFYLTFYGSQGLQLDDVSAYFDDDIRWMGDMRSGATMAGMLYFLYDGNGDYFMVLDDWSDTFEVKIPIEL